MAGFSSNQLFNVGSSGNGSSASQEVNDADYVCMEVIVETAGTTATYALEGSMDNSNWFPARVVDSASETAASNAVYTTTGRRLLFLKNDLGHFYRFFRCTVSANTGQVYSVKLHVIDQD